MKSGYHVEIPKEVDSTDSDLIEVTLDLQSWVQADLERQVIDSGFTMQDAVRVLARKATKRLLVHENYYRFWEALSSISRGKSQPFESESEDFAELCDLVNDFPFTLPKRSSMAKKGKRRTYRFPQWLHKHFYAISQTLGMNHLLFLEIMIIDGLRGQDGAVFNETMESTITEFYFQLSRRLRRLYASLRHVWDLKLSDEVVKVLEEIEEWEGL
ncbi:MAG TPA: hypothetical protein VLB76_15865 [Thermoanaerobaculia bacterium]|nr:hypothetical protein [Thermoanaerobaculia bacterium]